MIEGIVDLINPFQMEDYMTFFKDDIKTKVEEPSTPALTPSMLLDIAATAARMKANQLGEEDSESKDDNYKVLQLKYEVDGHRLGLSCRDNGTYVLSYADDTYISLTPKQVAALKDLLRRVVPDTE